MPDPSHSTTDVASRLAAFATEFNKRLDETLDSPQTPASLMEAIRYSALAPGKRVRPYLLVTCCGLAGGDATQAWIAAAAIECVHAFSLVHDDLPAMDNDDFRRGRRTTHKEFGEAMAILAGDALLSYAFELLARRLRPHPRLADIVLELATSTGASGMIGGQAADILGEGQPPTLSATRAIHDRKTACLFAASCRIGAHVAVAPFELVQVLGDFGRHLGLAFQIADDLLDLTASTEILGKRTQKDEGSEKQTYPRCVGLAASHKAADDEIERALLAIAPLGPEADTLREFARYMINRTY